MLCLVFILPISIFIGVIIGLTIVHNKDNRQNYMSRINKSLDF